MSTLLNCVIVQDDGVKVRYCDRVIHIGASLAASGASSASASAAVAAAAVVIMVTILFQATKSLRP